MVELTTAINVIAIALCIVGAYRNWILAKGAAWLKQVYVLQILMGLMNITFLILLVEYNSEIWGVMSLHSISVWTILMGIKGLYREYK